MLGFRPKPTDLYLERPRLLRRLPDSEGYVVWLEAPYGYGKSVLSSQWASHLEHAGWRVLWLSSQGRELQSALAGVLELPGELLWSTLLDAIWAQPTLLVLEDLEGNEALNPLLKDVRGLLLLASRGSLPLQELPRLKTQGRLVHLRAPDLSFTLDEANALFDYAKGRPGGAAEKAWSYSGGWSLPLHFASLTGEAPQASALLEGIHESLSVPAWQEALFLSALPFLPFASSVKASQELAASGFVQELESGLRLHPLTAEVIQETYNQELQDIVKQGLQRLPLTLQAEALARAKLFTDLEALTEAHFLLGRDDPEGVVRWDELCTSHNLTARGPGRLLGLAWAHSSLGRSEAAAQSLDEVLQHPAATPDQLLNALGWRLFDLPPSEHALAEALMQRADSLMPKGSRECIGIFLSNAAAFFLKTKAWEQLAQMQQKALSYLTAAGPISAVKQQQAEVHWELTGDLDTLIQATRENLRVQQTVSPYNVPNNHYDLGIALALLSIPAALTHFEQAEAGASHNLMYAITARAERAALLRDPEPFAPLIAQANAWRRDHPDMFERICALWARALRLTGEPEAALKTLERIGGLETIEQKFTVASERSLALLALGQPREALSSLPGPAACKRRLTRLELQAARYLLTHDEADLAALLDATTAREKVLPALVPLEALPVNLPELSRAYPLFEVLGSGWRDAITLRHKEIPPLKLKVLSRFDAIVLGSAVELTGRHKALLFLLALGYDRDIIGEALWPEIDAKKVTNNLHVQLNLLRKSLEPWGLKTYLDERGLLHTQTDLWELEAALEHSDAKTTLRLYREPLAPGVELSLADEVRDTLRERVLEVFFRAAAKPDGEMYLERLLELDPLHEEALQLLLARLIQSGRRRDATKRYQRFAKQLKDELGLEPLPETQNLHRDASRGR